MGMESPETAVRLMTPTGRICAGRSYFPPGSALTTGRAMQLPTSLTIAIWATGALWVVAILAYYFQQPIEIVIGAFVLGCFTGCLEAWKLLD